MVYIKTSKENLLCLSPTGMLANDEPWDFPKDFLGWFNGIRFNVHIYKAAHGVYMGYQYHLIQGNRSFLKNDLKGGIQFIFRNEKFFILKTKTIKIDAIVDTYVWQTKGPRIIAIGIIACILIVHPYST